MTHLTNDELQLFAELLDEVPGEDARLLRDRIETHLYLAGHYHQDYDVIQLPNGNWHAQDGHHEGFGETALEAIDNLERDMGKRR